MTDQLVPLSHLILDWQAPPDVDPVRHLTSLGIDVHRDDLGRPSVSRSDARALLAEQADAEQRRRAKLQRIEAAAEAEQRRYAQVPVGIPASDVPPGSSPAEIMIARGEAAGPRRPSVFEQLLADELSH
jgi:hypothetical protein